MNKFYNITMSNGATEYTLSYELKDHRPAQMWAALMKDRPIYSLRPSLNPWHGVKGNIQPMVDKLMSLIEELNKWVPNKINKIWNPNDIQGSANAFHTHFPEHKDETDKWRRAQLTQYNDLIHAIEGQDRTNRRDSEHIFLLVCPNAINKIPYELDDYQYFNGDSKFGDLCIGYNHIGRHPIELFYANDVDVPTDQILCEHLIGPIHFLFFHDAIYDRNKFKEFYYNSGINWPYAFDDPRLAVGRINIGNLKYVNGEELSREEILLIIKSCNRIVNWSIE